MSQETYGKVMKALEKLGITFDLRAVGNRFMAWGQTIFDKAIELGLPPGLPIHDGHYCNDGELAKAILERAVYETSNRYLPIKLTYI